MPGFLAGTAGFDITPPLGVALSGYAGRPGPADRIFDRLHVRALALASGDGGAAVALAGIELLGISDEMVAGIRAQLADVIPAERLLLNCSHTHAGPTTAAMRGMGAPDPAYCDLVVRWTASAVRLALRELRPARLGFGAARASVGVNRRLRRGDSIVIGENPAGPYDAAVAVLRVESDSGEPLACWFSHGTHPVVMDFRNTGVSAEWPGIAAARLRGRLGCPAIFGQGCCGDINPAKRGGYDVVLSVGEELADAAEAAWNAAAPVDAGAGLAAAAERVLLPPREWSVAEAEAALATAADRERLAEEQAREDPAGLAPKRQATRAAREWAEDCARSARRGRFPPVPLEAQALRIGDVVVAALSAEPFVEIGLEARRRSPLPRTVVLGYSNGCFGYLPTAAAFAEGGYEVDGAQRYYGRPMITPAAEDLAISSLERLFQRISIQASSSSSESR